MFKNKLFFFIQALLRYFPFKLGIFLRNFLYPFFFKSYGKHIRIFDAVVIKYPNEIQLGDNVTINNFCYIVGKGGLIINENVMIGAGSKITTSNHNFTDITIPMLKQGVSFEQIKIEKDVWIGFNVVVLGGSMIGNGSILAANSVITGGEVIPYSIMGGVPAKLIKTRI